MSRQRVAIYARVSGRTQALKGSGIREQIATCRKWARANDATVAEVFTDAGVSGRIEERPELARALSRLRSHDFDRIVVADLSRLARDLFVQESIIRDVRRGGGEVVSVAQPDLEGDDPTRVLTRQVLGALAEYERAMMVARLAAARRSTSERRGYSIHNPRFGFRVVDGAIVANPHEAAALALMRKLRGQGRSYKAIADELNSRGMGARRGGRWYPQTVARTIAYGNRPHGASTAARSKTRRRAS